MYQNFKQGQIPISHQNSGNKNILNPLTNLHCVKYFPQQRFGFNHIFIFNFIQFDL